MVITCYLLKPSKSIWNQSIMEVKVMRNTREPKWSTENFSGNLLVVPSGASRPSGLTDSWKRRPKTAKTGWRWQDVPGDVTEIFNWGTSHIKQLHMFTLTCQSISLEAWSFHAASFQEAWFAPTTSGVSASGMVEVDVGETQTLGNAEVCSNCGNVWKSNQQEVKSRPK